VPENRIPLQYLRQRETLSGWTGKLPALWTTKRGVQEVQLY